MVRHTVHWQYHLLNLIKGKILSRETQATSVQVYSKCVFSKMFMLFYNNLYVAESPSLNSLKISKWKIPLHIRFLNVTYLLRKTDKNASKFFEQENCWKRGRRTRTSSHFIFFQIPTRIIHVIFSFLSSLRF